MSPRHGTTSSSSPTSTVSSAASATASTAAAIISSTSTCGQDWGTVQPIVGTMSYHTLITIIAGACSILGLIICGLLAATHLSRYRRSDQQKQIVRIIWTPAVIALFSVFGVWFYGSASYVKPIGEYYECFSLVAIFYLFINYATPGDVPEGAHPFFKLDIIAATYNTDISSLYKTWIAVLQIIVVRLIVLIVTLATSGSECQLVGKKTHTQTILGVIQTGSTVICLMALLRTHKALKSKIAGYHAMTKLLCLKVIVFLDVFQSLVFSILSNEGDINPTKYANIPDLMIGTQDFILCCECFLVSILFIFAYSPREYSSRNHAAHAMEGQQRVGKKKNFCVAIFDCLNIADIIMGLFYCIQAFSGRGGNDPRTYGNQQAYANQQKYTDQQAYAGQQMYASDVNEYGRERLR